MKGRWGVNRSSKKTQKEGVHPLTKKSGGAWKNVTSDKVTVQVCGRKLETDIQKRARLT